MIVLLAKETVYSFEDCLKYIENNKKVIKVEYDGDFLIGREITKDNYDELVCEFYEEEQGFAEIYCDVMVFENESIVNVPKGEYEIEMIGEIV